MVPRETPPGSSAEPSDESDVEAPTNETPVEHEPSGLDLARTLARSTPGVLRKKRRPRSVEPKFSGSHPDDRDPQLLVNTVERLIGERGWRRDVQVHSVVGRWAEIVGAEVAQHCRPESYDAETRRLRVRTESTAWATQLRLLSPQIIRRLAEVLGDGEVAVIDVQGPIPPSWSKGPRRVSGGRGPRDTYG